MINKKVSTIAGSLIILAIVVALGCSFLGLNKKEEMQDQNNVGFNNSELGNEEEVKQEEIIENIKSEGNYNRPDRSKYNKPSMPTLADESGKTPDKLVEDFYNWYIKSNNYWIYQLYRSDNETDDEIISPVKLAETSIFVSSNYKQNIAKRITNGDPALCTQDTEYNIIKNYNNVQISNSNAEVEVIRGYQDISDTAKVRVILVKENDQWKIDDIICTNLIK